MITTDIRQRVRDNINRDDSGINTKIESWINDAKRRVEQQLNMDYMRTVDKTLVATNAAPSPTLPARWKAEILVKYRKTLPAGEEEASWTEINKLSEHEVLRVEGFEGSPLAVVTGAPLGYTLEETTLTVHPKPETGKTYTLAIAYWRFSANWTFAVNEEPYLAANAHRAIIDSATSLGFSMLGELQDAKKWELMYSNPEKMGSYDEFRSHEMKRSLMGEVQMRPGTGARETRPSAILRWY